MPNDSKNTLVFIVIAMAMLLLYQMFVMQPAMQRKQAEARAQAAAAQANKPAAVAAPGVVPAGVPAAPPPIVAPRIPIDTPSLKGSLSLAGGRIDSLDLKRYHETLAPSSPLVGLFRPAGKPGAYFADFGWTGANLPGLPDARTVWTARSTGPLAPNRPLVLTYRSPQGLDFTRVVSVDDKYMFTVKDTVANYGAAPVTIAPYATVQRQGLPQSHAQNVHEGGIGVADGKLKLFKYGSWKKKTPSVDLTSTGGWFGITDKYWMAAVIPEQAQAVRATFRVTQPGGQDVYDASYLGGYKIIAPGKQTTWTSRLFAGAKTVPILKSYKDAGIPRFEDAVDWGWFWFFTKPIFSLLHVFYQLMGNFGLAIMLLTVVIKVLFFWPANKSYESMTKMKKVQPELEQIKKRHKDDPAKQQQAMMALYAQEKINPFMGCLPILI
ncbi:MAG: membrane protein insertase YidC, partial [Caulobacteraceae bacterium]